MKTLYFLVPFYLMISTAMTVMEVNDRLQDHYATRYMAQVEGALPEHLK